MVLALKELSVWRRTFGYTERDVEPALIISHGNTSIMDQGSGLEKGASCWDQASALVRVKIPYGGRWSSIC